MVIDSKEARRPRNALCLEKAQYAAYQLGVSSARSPDGVAHPDNAIHPTRVAQTGDRGGCSVGEVV